MSEHEARALLDAVHSRAESVRTKPPLTMVNDARRIAGTHTFYIDERGKCANVRIGRHRADDGLSHEYLTTDPDGLPPTGLLALPDCPTSK